MSGAIHSRRGWQSVLVLFGALLMLTPASQARLGHEVLPTHETIELRLNADTTVYDGMVTIDLAVKEATDSFQLHAEKMQLTHVVLTDADNDTIATSWETAHKGLTTFTTEKRLSPGKYLLVINFTNDFNMRAVSLYRVTDDGGGYLFTQFEENDARGAFPCWDEPEFKIPFKMILTVPEAHIAVSNTPVQAETISEGWKRVEFEETKPLPTYLLAIATGPLDAYEISGLSVPGSVYTVKGHAKLTALARSMTPAILNALEKYFGRPYPYKKLDLIAVPEFWAGAMENAGAVTFREPILTADSATATVSQRRRLAAVIAHEFAHMWFGDLVTMQWWDDLWLNESFASWMGDKITNEVFPEFDMPIRVVRTSEGVMSADARKTTSPIRQQTQDDDNLLQNIGIIYSKGEAVLEMFEKWLGEETFQRGVRDYLKAHEWGNATADDFFSALSEAAGRDVTAPLSGFILQPGVPLVKMTPGDSGRITISQQRFANYGVTFDDTLRWQIPIALKYGIEGQTNVYSLLLTGADTTITLPEGKRPAWILPNAEMSGYYRWEVPALMLVKMAKHAPEMLTPAERVGFLSNLSGLFQAGLLHGAGYLAVVNQFGQDPDPNVISSLIGLLSGVHEVFVNDTNRAQFATFVRETLRPAVDRFSLEPKEDEPGTVSSLRPRLLGFIADEGADTAALNLATRLAHAYLQDPKTVDPSLVGTSLSLAAIHGDTALFDTYVDRFRNAQTPVERSRFLSALGYFHDDTLVAQALSLAMSGDLRPQERGTIPQTVASQSPRRADQVFDWLMANYDTIVAWLPPPSRSFLVFYASGCSEQRLEKAKAFFGQPEHQGPGIEHRLARVTESVESCVALRAREGERVNMLLSRFGASN